MSIQRQRRRLSGQEFVDQTYTGLDLRNAVAQGCRFIRCKFIDCKMDLGAFGDATFVECVFERCSLLQAQLVSRLYSCGFAGCSMDQVMLTGADIQDTSFTDCRMQYSNWDRSTVQRTEVRDCDLHGARLDFAVTEGVDFTGSNLWGVVVPISCATFVGNRFDRRQMHMLLALLSKSLGNDHERTRIRSLVDERYERLVGRLVNAEIDGGESQACQDEGRPVHADVADQDAAVGDRGDSLRVLAG